MLEEAMRVFVSALTLLVLSAGAAVPSFAMKNRTETLDQPCDVVWKSAVTAAKRQEYRIVGISQEEQIISVAVGGFWAGERIVSLSLAPSVERGCVATVQSRFSGLIHSDGPDFLARVRVQLIADTLPADREAFHKFKDCVEYSPSASEAKCEAKFRQKLAAKEQAQPNNLPPSRTDGWWKSDKPAQTEAQK
jgi:hypothetical protein